VISKYVTLEEATKSQTAIRLGIENQPSPEEIERMKYVASNVFDKVREHLGKPLGVSSFFRSEKLNKAIGGSKTSQHRYGEAIDIDADIYGGSNREIFNYIKDNLEFDQLIGEGVKPDGDFQWVHVSLKKSGNRKEILIATFPGGKVKYEKYKTT
jgi:zinc D-Ala-D-Ala carboxypeptidase